MRKRRQRLVALLFVVPGLGFAANAQAADIGVSAHGGTLGVGLDLAYGFNRYLSGRVGFNSLTLEEDFTEEGIEYSTDLELESVHALADWHVFGGGFRLTGGAILNNNAFDGSASIEAGDEIGDATAIGSGSLALDVEYDEVAPYLGIGWGNRASGRSGVSFAVDAGLMFQGSPDVDITESGSTGVQQSDLDKEEKEVEDELDDFEIYPVLSASVVFRF
ncbi:MAG: hypothetical protein U5K33_03950 [Halofilum sp. (in: g-proteobacteria)]|nr:hypothetical protein [Halofilum sp. (in: g-proteobacteria)]